MATRTLRVCDLDEKEDDVQEVLYGADELFRADLCAADRAKLDKALEPFTKVGTPIDLRNAAKAANGFPAATVRAWAQANGKQLGDRGRIPAEVVAAWRASLAK